MNTHQEIREEIEACSKSATHTSPWDILHALNDRIEALEKQCCEDVAAVEKRLEEIHPTIT